MFKRRENAFGDGVVSKIASTVHVLHDAVRRQRLLVVMIGVLTARIRVMEQAGGWLAPGERALQRGQPECRGERRADRLADDAPGGEI